MLATDIPRLETFTQRFWARVDKSGGADACWPWQKRCNEHGYGVVAWRGNGRAHSTRSSRIAYLLTHGFLPDDVFILHECDNPPCCNPRHLHEGNYQMNADEKALRGRLPCGDRHWTRRLPERVPRGHFHRSAKLRAEQVCAIRERYKPKTKGSDLQSLADEFGVSEITVFRVVHGLRYKNAT